MITDSLQNSIAESDYEKFEGAWEEFTKNMIYQWKEYQRFWLEMDIPKFIVKYEDLIEKPEETLGKLIEFVLQVDSIKGTKVEKLISQTCKTYKGPYKTRPWGGEANKQFKKYSDVQKKYVLEVAKDEMEKLGYMGQFGESNETKFIEEQNSKNMKMSLNQAN